MAESLDVDEKILIVDHEGGKYEVQISYLPPESLWAVEAEDKNLEAIDIPPTIPTKGGDIPVTPEMVKAIMDYLQVMEGSTLPVAMRDEQVDEKRNKWGYTVKDPGARIWIDGKAEPRKIRSSDPTNYI